MSNAANTNPTGTINRGQYLLVPSKAAAELGLPRTDMRLFKGAWYAEIVNPDYVAPEATGFQGATLEF